MNSGVDFFRRWNIFGMMGETSVQVDIAYDQGYEQHFVEAEGVFAVARADIENDVFSIDQPTGREYEFERLGINLREGISRARQAISTFSSYAGSKFSSRFSGAPYRSSMLNGIESCYARVRSHDSARRETGIEFAVEVANCLESIQKKIPSRIIENSVEPSLQSGPDESPLENADILIIGATGFIGKCLLAKLLKAGTKARVLVRNPSFLSDANIAEDFECVIGDFRDEAAVSRALQGVSVVIHLAVSHGKSLDGYLRQDSDPTIRLAEKCRDLGIKRFIYTGTIDSLSLSSPVALRESDGTDQKIERRNNYAHSKAITESRLNAMYRQSKFPVVIVRPAIVLGSGGSPLHVGVAKWSGIGRCEFWGKGSNFLPLVLVDDVCDAIVSAVDADGIEGKTYNLSSDSCVSAREYVEQVESVLGYSVKQRNVSAFSNFGTDLAKWIVKFMVGHPDKTRIPSLHDWKCREQLAHFDTTAAQNDLGWRPTQDRDRIVREGIVEPTKSFINSM